jgi:hypothetical protein
MDDNIETKEKKNKIISIFIILLLVIIGIISYARYIGTTGIQVIENAVIDEELPSSFNGFKIVQFADIHYGRTTSLKDIKKIVTKINDLKPDVVIFTGDLFDKDIKITDDDVNNLKEILASIDANINKYAVKGDSDYNYITEYETIFKYADFNILDNASDFIYYKDITPIKIIGTTSLLKSEIDYTSAFDNFEDENDYFTILISHEPTIIDNLNDNKVNVIFASHSLGGLINIPLVGGIIKYKGSNNYIKGYYDVNNIQMYVNSGIGTQDYSFRFNNRPCINLYRIYNY